MPHSTGIFVTLAHFRVTLPNEAAKLAGQSATRTPRRDNSQCTLLEPTVKHIVCRLSRLAVLGLMIFAVEAAWSAEIDLETARQQFRAAQALCTAEGGKLWGISLCGPIMFVDPQTRRIVTNQADA